MIRPEIIYIMLATLAYGCLVAGLIKRKEKNIHMRWMLSGITLDLFIVLILEMRRNVVVAALTHEFSFCQKIHIYASGMATALYIPVLILGFILIQNTALKGIRFFHRMCGAIAFVFRSVGFMTMFSMLWKQSVHE